MEAKVLLVLFFAGLLAFSIADDGDSNGSDSGDVSGGSFETSRESQDEDCDRMVDGSDDNGGSCDLTDGLEQVPDEVDCTPDEKTTIIDWITSLKVLLSVKVSIQERLVIALSSIQKFQMEYPQLYSIIQFQNISGFGYLASFTQVIKYRQSFQLEGLITLDDDDNCPFFDALFNCTEGSYEQESAINAFINETLVDICGNFSLSVKERYVLIYQALTQFFSIHAEWQVSFFQYQIAGFGSIQQLFEITRQVYQSTQIDVIFEGEVSECQFMVSLRNQLTLIQADASISVTMKGVMQQFYNDCETQLGTCTSGKCRMALMIKLMRQFVSMYGSKYAYLIYGIEIEGFGNCWEMMNCGPIRNPPPTKAPTIKPTTISAPTSIKPTCGCTCDSVTTGFP